jgi:hypothetical protein
MAEPIKVPTTIRTSFELYKSEELSNIDALYVARTVSESPRGKLIVDIEELAKQRKLLALLVDYYDGELAAILPGTFRYLTTEQKKYQKKQLLFTYYLFYCQYKLDKAEDRKYRLQEYQKAMTLCDNYLSQLENSPSRGEQFSPQKNLQQAINDSEKCLALLGMTNIAPWFVEKIREFSDGKTKAVRQWIDEINNQRLYWSWGNSMLLAILSNLPNDFFNKQQTERSLIIPNQINGSLGWILYYIRFGIDLFLLLKHTIGMGKGESKIPPIERFKTQWNQRKYDLLNDSIWATANLVCYFWLVGNGMCGYAGNLLTIGLYLVDLALATWKYWEESTEHNAKIRALESDKESLKKLQQEQISRINLLQKKNDDNQKRIEELFAKLEALTSQINRSDEHNKKDLQESWNANFTSLRSLKDETEKNQNELKAAQEKHNDLAREINRVTKIKIKAELDWKYRRYGLMRDLMYALGIVLAFSITCSPFFPPAAIVPATVMILGALGATLCFVINFVHTIASNYFEIAKSADTNQLKKTEYTELLKQFDQEHEQNIKKQLYLEIEALKAESKYHQDLTKYQSSKLVHSILIDAILPAMVFACFTFLPFGIGIGVFAASLVLTLISHIIIRQFCSPKPPNLPEFQELDEEKYSLFVDERAQLTTANVESVATSTNCFFAKGKKSPDLRYEDEDKALKASC